MSGLLARSRIVWVGENIQKSLVLSTRECVRVLDSYYTGKEVERMKKEWTKPKLISLYRGRPEEAVLQNCKSAVTQEETSGTGDLRGCIDLCLGIVSS